MKQKYLIFAIVIALLAFTASACTSDTNYFSSDKEVKSDNSAEVELNDDNIEVEDDKAPLVSGNYQVNTADSQVIWHGYRLVGSDHTGTVAVKSGSLQIDDGSLAGGQFVIDLNSLKSDEGLASLETHLKSADFFDVGNYPEASLVITQVTKTIESDAYQVDANLTIKGITAPVSFEAELEQNGANLQAETDLEIDRTIWNLKYGSGKFFQDLGDKIISDDIDFKIKLQASMLSEL